MPRKHIGTFMLHRNVASYIPIRMSQHSDKTKETRPCVYIANTYHSFFVQTV